MPRQNSGRGMNVSSCDHFNERTLPVLTPPDLSHETITATLRDHYRLRIDAVTFLPLGADVNSAVYRVAADDGTPYFLKLRRADFDAIAVTVPAFLHAQGITQVMAAQPTASGQLWTRAHGFVWILYPFFAGHNAYERPLTATQWAILGRCLRAVHSTTLPEALAHLVPRETYSPRWRDVVRTFSQQVETLVYDDPIARRLAASWLTKREDILVLVERAEALGAALRQRPLPFVLCHTDLHAWNVLVGENDELAIVDWDNPIFAPKERDLMFIGGGIGAIWDSAQEQVRFYAGYDADDATDIDLTALSYYRYERIVEDFAAYGEQIFCAEGSTEDRENGLRKVMGQFLPGLVIDIAHQTYQRLLSR
jgi:spectinomycin phosphotransferase